ncbi:MAG: sialate O-acetylesterase [Bacteroidota bacterium]
MSKLKFGLLLLLFFCIIPDLFGQVTLPRLISDGMVLQRNTGVTIWGWASGNEEIELNFKGEQYQTTADDSGNWSIELDHLSAGGPNSMTIVGENRLTIRDIYVGDVWVASGQSNMELPMERVRPLYEKEIREAQDERIRYFGVPYNYDFKTPQDDVESGEWVAATPENVLSFSAAAYFFAQNLVDSQDVPVGIIHSAMGGSPAEAWVSEEALKEFPRHYEEAQRFKDDSLIEEIEHEDQTRISDWYRRSVENDRGLTEDDGTWKDPDLDTSDWSTMELPGYWNETGLGEVNGVVWFRKTVELPGAAAGRPAKMDLGRVVDADSVFVNGQFVGNTTYQYPPRRYEIPEGVLESGENTVVVRVVNERGNGGFFPDKPYRIYTDDWNADLTGDWKYRLGVEMEPLPGQTFIRWKPLGLFNGMIHPLLKYDISGVIWYQGESNTGNPEEYSELFPALIDDWRNHWEEGEFPFLYVQLANFMEPADQPEESNWAALRQAQLETLSQPNTGMAVTIDIGEWNDIHPLNKKDVGQRLARWARGMVYGEEIVQSGPIVDDVKNEGNRLVLTFTHTGSGLVSENGDLKEFAVADDDGEFKWARARIEGDTVVVWNDEIENPVHVRYAWADNPEDANLYNEEGLPASPFEVSL